jgi:hypothetical protein
MTNKDDKHDSLIARFLSNLSKEGIERQTRHEFRQGRPHLTEAEVEIMFQAGKKAAWPPWSLEHAKLILSDNVWVFTPAWDSPYGGSRYSRHDLAERPPCKHFAAFRDHWPHGGLWE